MFSLLLCILNFFHNKTLKRPENKLKKKSLRIQKCKRKLKRQLCTMPKEKPIQIGAEQKAMGRRSPGNKKEKRKRLFYVLV